MSDKQYKMLRKMKVSSTHVKRLWKSLSHVQKGQVRAKFKEKGTEEALALFEILLTKEKSFRPF